MALLQKLIIDQEPGGAMRVAIIDLGTNTFNLLIADGDETGRLSVVHREERAVFLGAGGIEQGVITDEAMTRAMDVLRDFHRQVGASGAERLQGFGTSALRNARNGKAFADRVKDDPGIDITIIPGDEEAALILDGVRQAVPFGGKPMLVMDIGGGSVEFILATDRALMWKQSFEIGATRLLERLHPSDPITLEEYFRVAAHLDARLEPLFAVMDRHWPTALVGSAGSFDTIAELVARDAGTAIGSDATTLGFDTSAFDAIKERLLFTTRRERQMIPGIPAYRVGTFPLALIAIERVLAHGIEELRWSRYALKEGAAWRLLQSAGPTVGSTH